MRSLDLDLVTRAFSFGSITGRIDAQVNGLELANWLPVKFDARVESSPGNYRKRISQRAVENITSLGGSSASAAIQRTALRFFDEFGYSRIGWSCKLRNGVCEMGGVGPGTGGYVIVEGGGVPAITVMGYNRAVDWEELIARLAPRHEKRQRAGNRMTGACMGGGCVVGWAVGMAAAALLSGCVTINIYFPAAAAEKAADKIIDEVWRTQKPRPLRQATRRPQHPQASPDPGQSDPLCSETA